MIENEAIIRIIAFIGSLLLMLLWQQYSPRRQTMAIASSRRVNNISLIIISNLIIRFFLPTITVSNVALLTEKYQWGLFQQFEMNSILVIILSFLLLDFLIYWQHRLFHKIPLLWRLHRMHHSDKDLDATSGIRFHPIEIILSIIIKSTAVMILGIPILAVLIFELILNVSPIFNHSNIHIPIKLDKYLRYFIVTPDMHRIHHSVIKNETNSNYGFSISLWDRLFKSYKHNPKLGQEKMIIGLNEIPQTDSVSLLALLIQPFKHYQPTEENS